MDDAKLAKKNTAKHRGKLIELLCGFCEDIVGDAEKQDRKELDGLIVALKKAKKGGVVEAVLEEFVEAADF